MPWRIEDGMKRIGANYVQAGLWRGFAARDSNLVTGHRTSPPPRRPPNSLRRLVNDVHQPVASDAFRSTASRVNRRPGRWRRLIARDQDASSPSARSASPPMDKCAASVRPDSVRSAMLADASNPQNAYPAVLGTVRSRRRRGGALSCPPRAALARKCGCCLVALTTAIK